MVPLIQKSLVDRWQQNASLPPWGCRWRTARQYCWGRGTSRCGPWRPSTSAATIQCTGGHRCSCETRFSRQRLASCPGSLCRYSCSRLWWPPGGGEGSVISVLAKWLRKTSLNFSMYYKTKWLVESMLGRSSWHWLGKKPRQTLDKKTLANITSKNLG